MCNLNFQLMSANNKEFDIQVTVKDKDGNRFESIESLDFDAKVGKVYAL